MKRFTTNSFRRHSSNVHCSDVSLDHRLTVGSPSGFNANSLLKLVSVLVLVLAFGVGNAWGDEVLLLGETFGVGNGSGGRDWSMDYAVQSGVSSVYSSTTYTVSGAKQTKSTTNAVLNQTTAGTAASIIIGPLAVASYTTLRVTYGWNAASTKGTYSAKLYYSTTSSTGTYTEISKTSGSPGTGGTFNTQTYNTIPAAAQVNTLYLKIVWNTSNTNGQIDNFALYGTLAASCTATPSIGVASLNGSFNLSQVGVSCASSGAGINCSITEYGWVWSDGATNTNPEIGGTGVTNNPKTTGAPSGTGGAFTGTLSGPFTVGHTYYYKAYVTNGKPATAYSTVQSFTPRQITFYKNDGTSTTSTQIVKNGVATNLTANSFTRTGHTFNGWNTQADGKGTDKANQASVTVSGGNLDLYAKWTKNNYTLTWNLNGGTVSVAGTGVAVNATGSPNSSVPYGDAITAPTVTKTGYTQNGWNTTPASTMPASNTTYTAQWTANKYNITYKDQGGGDFSGTQTNAPTQHTYGTATTLKIPTKTGYTFEGWFTASDCTSGAVGNTTSASLAATGYTAAITLYAKWTIKSHTLTWNFNGGESSATASTDYTAGGTVNYGTDITRPANNTMSKYGYEFSSWSSNATTMPDNDLTITANWTVKSFTVTWMVNGVEWSGKGGSTSVNFGSHVAAIPSTAPTPADACGDKFMGWTTDEEFVLGTSSLFTTAAGAPVVSVEGNVTYHAVFADYAE